MVHPLLSFETLIFDIVHNTIVILVAFLVYRKTRELYKLSMQRGICYFSGAMIFFMISYLFRYITIISNFITEGAFMSSVSGLMVNFLNVYAAAMGGFYLAYSLVWRKLEGRGSHLGIAAFLFAVGFTITLADTYLLITYGVTQFYFFFVTVILFLLLAIISNCKRCVKCHDMGPFLSLVGLGLGVFVVIFIENLSLPFLYTIHYYSSAITLVFSLALLYNVIKITKW